MANNLFLKTAEYLFKFSADPLGFVLAVFPWGKAGTSLSHAEGPDVWQTDILTRIQNDLSWELALQIAISSGHGVGKSSLVAWIILWAMATRVNTKGVVTANTDVQLRTKTWAELAKWYNLAPLLHPMFELTATSLVTRDPARRKEWVFDKITWNEKSTEAFAGLHNQGRRLVVIFDEASAIPEVVWEVTEGAMTDQNTEILWLVCGNPTRATGRFRECWGRFQHIWSRLSVDSRTVKITNKRQIERWREAYGEDSDFFRVRVRGVFPRVGSMQFVPTDLVQAAAAREAVATIFDPFVMGVDVARFGDDVSVIAFRRGRDARSIPWQTYSGVDTYTLATRIVEEAKTHRPDAIFVDEGGVGAGVVDRLKFLRLPVVGVQFGSAPDRSRDKQEGSVAYSNKRAEMWGSMRDWLRGGAISDSVDLYNDLVNIEYGYRVIHGQDCIQLEKKEDLKRRGHASPDRADALALTFAYPVMPSDHSDSLSGRDNTTHQHEYNPYEGGWRLLGS